LGVHPENRVEAASLHHCLGGGFDVRAFVDRDLGLANQSGQRIDVDARALITASVMTVPEPTKGSTTWQGPFLLFRIASRMSPCMRGTIMAG
jgi:hypothetical protein